jgi:hypothetical protein
LQLEGSPFGLGRISGDEICGYVTAREVVMLQRRHLSQDHVVIAGAGARDGDAPDDGPLRGSPNERG